MALFDIRQGALFQISQHTLYALTYLAILPSIVTVYILQFATPILGPVKIMAFTYLIPIQVLLINLSIGIASFEWYLAAPVLITFMGTCLVQINIPFLQPKAIKETE
ncbi:MAG: hypothetical protein OXE99_13010 [Cellvibrionales bacterium]|nr:hypothetical protein [Cellvibrionales bacterium]